MYRDFKTTILLGSTGTGKSYFIKQYIQEILDDEKDDSRLIILDPKRVDLKKISNHSKVIAYLSDNIEGTFDKLTLPLIRERIDNFACAKGNQHLPKIYFFFDEYLDTFPVLSIEGDKAVKYLVNFHNQLNIELIISSQREGMPNLFFRKADTVINFTTYPKDEIRSTTSIVSMGKYLDFRNVGVSGNPEMVAKFLNSYQKQIPDKSKVYTFLFN